MDDKKTFSELMDRSKLDRLDGEILALAADLEAQGYHPIDITNALQSAILIRLKREGFINSNLYWKRMKSHVEGWFSDTDSLFSEVRERVDKERAADRDNGRRNKRGQIVN